MRDQSKLARRFLWSAHPVCAIAEAWAWGFLILFLLWRLAGTVTSSVMGNGWFALAGAAGIWAVLRARLPKGAWWKQTLWELAVGLALSLVMVAGIMGPVYLLNWEATWQTAYANSFPSWVLMLGVGPGFVFTRGVVHLWLFGNRLRRRRMLWALTFAHLSFVVILISLWAVYLLVFGPLKEILRYDPQSGSFWTALATDLLVTLFPAAMVVILLTMLMLVVVLPPSALLSFLVARKTTRRLEDLAKATGALRDGNYATRIEIVGEDEVAKLQSDFNAMAKALETTLHDLKAERDKVAGLLQAQRELTAAVSHELRTPIATVQGYLEQSQAQWDKAPAGLQSDLAVIEGEINRLQRLIDDLFALSQAEVGELALELKRVDLSQVIQQVVETWTPLAWQRGRVELTAECPDELPAVLADRDRLVQILTNLLGNGVRHTPPGGIVAVAATPADELIRIEVRDTGEGIPPEELSLIWERFYRGRDTRDAGQEGAGLGLALVKELTEAMGGSVGVESAPGQGTCFTVFLPIV